MSLHHGRLAVGQPTNESRENENQLKGPATTACIPCGTWWMLGPQCLRPCNFSSPNPYKSWGAAFGPSLPQSFGLVGGLWRFWNVCCVSAPRFMRTWMPWSSLSWSQRARPSESHQLSCLLRKNQPCKMHPCSTFCKFWVRCLLFTSLYLLTPKPGGSLRLEPLQEAASEADETRPRATGQDSHNLRALLPTLEQHKTWLAMH